MTAPRVSIPRWNPKTVPFVAGVASSERRASLAPVLIHFQNLSIVLMKKTHRGEIKTIIRGREMALKKYPVRIKGVLLPELSESLPKYVLLSHAVASAIHSKIPIKIIEKPMYLRYIGITG